MVSYGKILRADKLKRTNERTNERTKKNGNIQRAACKVLHMLQLLSYTDIEFYVYIVHFIFIVCCCSLLFFFYSFTNVYLFSFVCIFGLVSHKLNSVAGEKKKKRQKNTSNQNVCDSQVIHSFDSVRSPYECESGGGFHSDMFVTF